MDLLSFKGVFTISDCLHVGFVNNFDSFVMFLNTVPIPGFVSGVTMVLPQSERKVFALVAALKFCDGCRTYLFSTLSLLLLLESPIILTYNLS